MEPRPYRQNRFTYVSQSVKYLIFFFNFLFWLFGGLLIGIGLYAFHDKWKGPDTIKVNTIYDILLDISLVLIIAGGVVFIVSFAGCVGALRENTCLLRFYNVVIIIFFILELVIAAIGFVNPTELQNLIEESFTDKVIHKYRENDDLRNFIDFAQKEFKCCGLSSGGYLDWSMNEYFNCTSPSSEKCGVPYSCCKNATNISGGLINIMCGYDVQRLSIAEASKKVWTTGCIEAVKSYTVSHLYMCAIVALSVAVSQLIIIFLAKTLDNQIELQRARWQM